MLSAVFVRQTFPSHMGARMTVVGCFDQKHVEVVKLKKENRSLGFFQTVWELELDSYQNRNVLQNTSFLIEHKKALACLLSALVIEKFRTFSSRIVCY